MTETYVTTATLPVELVPEWHLFVKDGLAWQVLPRGEHASQVPCRRADAGHAYPAPDRLWTFFDRGTLVAKLVYRRA